MLHYLGFIEGASGFPAMGVHRFDARSVGVGHGYGKVYLEFRDADSGEVVFWIAMDPVSAETLAKALLDQAEKAREEVA